jgi:glycerophosphoryl diester phosphodiesterase
VLSFHDEALREVREYLPGVRTVLVAGRLGPEIVERAQDVGAHLVSLELRRIYLELVRQCHRAGIAVMAWTVNTAQELALARALGLDGAATDVPEIKRAVVAGESAG